MSWRERADEDNRRNRDRSPGRYRDRFRLILRTLHSQLCLRIRGSSNIVSGLQEKKTGDTPPPIIQ